MGPASHRGDRPALQRLYVAPSSQLESNVLVKGMRGRAPNVRRYHEARAAPTPRSIGGSIDELAADPEPASALGDDEGGDQSDVGVVVQPGEAMKRDEAEDVGTTRVSGYEDEVGGVIAIRAEHARQALSHALGLGRIAELPE